MTSNTIRALTPTAIKYLLTLSQLCTPGKGARCVAVAERLGVSKPSVHSMVRNLSALGLVQKEPYGIVYLTDEGRDAAALYETCYAPLCQRIRETLGLEEDACINAACAVLAQVPDQLDELARRLA